MHDCAGFAVLGLLSLLDDGLVAIRSLTCFFIPTVLAEYFGHLSVGVLAALQPLSPHVQDLLMFLPSKFNFRTHFTAVLCPIETLMVRTSWLSWQRMTRRREWCIIVHAPQAQIMNMSSSFISSYASETAW